MRLPAVALGGEAPGEAAREERRERGVEEPGGEEAGERAGEAGQRRASGSVPCGEGAEPRPVAEEAGLGAEEVGPEDEVPSLREAGGRGARVEDVVEARGERGA